MQIFIRNMVCLRCKMVVKDELSKLGLRYVSVELGKAEIIGDVSPDILEKIRIELLRSGLELMDDKKSILIEKIKSVIIEQVNYSEEPLTVNFSDFLSKKLSYDYTYLANLFSQVQGTTIEQFIIIHKIERVKELLVYDELSLTQIASQMHYSSLSHLSIQFKKVTGLTATHFKKLRDKRRNMLEKV